MKQSKHRTLLSIICSILITLFATILLTTTLTYVAVFRQQNILKVMEASDWYEQGYQELIHRVEDQNKDTQIPLSTITNVITLNRYYIDQRDYVINAISGSVDSYSYDELNSNLKQSFVTYFEQQGIAISDSLAKTIDKITETVTIEYEGWIQSQLFKELGELKNTFKTLLRWIIPFTIIGMLVFTIALFQMYGHKHKSIRYLSYSFISVFFINVVIYIIFDKYIYLNNIHLSTKFYSQFALQYLKNVQNIYLFGVAISGIVFVILSFIGYSIKRSKIRE